MARNGGFNPLPGAPDEDPGGGPGGLAPVDDGAGFLPEADPKEDRRLERLLTPGKKTSDTGLLHRYADFPAGHFTGLGGGFGFQTQSYNPRDALGQTAWGHIPYGRQGPNPLYYANPFYRPWFDVTVEGPGGFNPKDPFKKQD